MPAIGDLRSRLMALADETLSGHPEIIALFNLRLSESLPQMALRHELEQLVSGHPRKFRELPIPRGL